LAFPGRVHFGGCTRLLEKRAVEGKLLVLKFASQGLVVFSIIVNHPGWLDNRHCRNDRVKTYAADRGAGCDRATNLRRKVTTAIHHAKYFVEHRENLGLRARTCQCGLKVPRGFGDVTRNRSVLQDKKAKAASRGTLLAARYLYRVADLF